ncbi:nucleoside hydrolase [Cohnella sp. GCM10012308]|uniref:nucleoside hydrolase n=1 Tax=Cohnella sp. GCM10012308 TaxID=3317329 RepID=UPI0036097EFF
MSTIAGSAQRVIIDTDIGDDIDDALAIWLAVKSPELDIAGITTVYKQTQKRAQMVSALLRATGRSDIPVVPGASLPLISRQIYGKPVDPEEAPVQYLEEMRSEPVDTRWTAAEFIVRTALEAERPIALVTLGALTNVALALRVKPEIADRIGKIVVMGGAYDMNVSEYNFSCDPEAAQIVLGAGVPIVAVGLDVTFKCLLSERQTAAIRDSADPAAKLVMRMREHWASPHIYLHDPLAVAAVYREDLVRTERRVVDIETGGAYTRGMSISLSGMNWHRPAADSHVRVSTGVEQQAFMDLYMERILAFTPIEERDGIA